jgi:hypothetical protein
MIRARQCNGRGAQAGRSVPPLRENVILVAGGLSCADRVRPAHTAIGSRR